MKTQPQKNKEHMDNWKLQVLETTLSLGKPWSPLAALRGKQRPYRRQYEKALDDLIQTEARLQYTVGSHGGRKWVQAAPEPIDPAKEIATALARDLNS